MSGLHNISLHSYDRIDWSEYANNHKQKCYETLRLQLYIVLKNDDLVKFMFDN